MSRLEIRISGFGGQGIILAGYILGKAISIYDGKNATLTRSYGPESRGGACAAELIISDGTIDYPKLVEPDITVIMSQEAYEKYGNDVKKGGFQLIDEDLVKLDLESNDESRKQKTEEHPSSDDLIMFSIPSTRYAEEVGHRIVGNIVMLGFLTAVTDVVSEQSMLKAITSVVPKGTGELNLKAFQRGFEYGKEVIESNQAK